MVRDLSTAEAGAVDKLRDRGIPDLVFHYHFLGAKGKKLFDHRYAVLRNLLRRSKVRTGLRELQRELRKKKDRRTCTTGNMARVVYAKTCSHWFSGSSREKAGRIFPILSACHYPDPMCRGAPSNSYPNSLAANLRHTNYVRLLSGSLENLPTTFAMLDQEEYREATPLQRNNKDSGLLKRIGILVADERMQRNNVNNVNNVNNGQQAHPLKALATES